ncbi:MAG: hypothetical protein QXT49_05185 [Candidatus Nezhaarchaeales archaeon]
MCGVSEFVEVCLVQALLGYLWLSRTATIRYCCNTIYQKAVLLNSDATVLKEKNAILNGRPA